MLELLQWIVLIAMGGVIAFLLKERQGTRLPCWLKDLQQEDLVSRSEFDQYHHRVIQMSQVQKDYFNSRFEELSRSLNPETVTIQSVVKPEEIPVTSQIQPPEGLADSLELPIHLDTHEYLEDPEEHSFREVDFTPHQPPKVNARLDAIDPAKRAIELFRDGKSIDQIAQELRIGRQEAQLLIRMSQFKSPFLAGV